MKKYIRCATISEDDEYVPNVSDSDGEYISETVSDEIKERYGKRYKKLRVDISDLSVNDNSVNMLVDVYNGDKLLKEDKFSFSAYDSYFDYQDYTSHLNRTIYKFVSNIITR